MSVESIYLSGKIGPLLCAHMCTRMASPGAWWYRTHVPMRETQEMWVRSLGWEDPLEKEMVTHYRIRAWESPWTEEPGGLQSMGSQESDMT